MRARVITAQLKYDQLGEAQRLYQEAFLPIAQQQAGFKSALLLIDRNSCQSLLITVWASDADLRASESATDYQRPLLQVAQLFANTPMRMLYEAETLHAVAS